MSSASAIKHVACLANRNARTLVKVGQCNKSIIVISNFLPPVWCPRRWTHYLPISFAYRRLFHRNWPYCGKRCLCYNDEVLFCHI